MYSNLLNEYRKASLITQLQLLRKDLFSLYPFSLVLCSSPQLWVRWSAASACLQHSRRSAGQVLGHLEVFTRSHMFVVYFRMFLSHHSLLPFRWFLAQVWKLHSQHQLTYCFYGGTAWVCQTFTTYYYCIYRI